MVENFVAEFTYLEYLQKDRPINDNQIFHNNDLQEEKEINFIVQTVGYPLKIYLVTLLLNPTEQN